jgi:ligand-binding sensor domain-containing protein
MAVSHCAHALDPHKGLEEYRRQSWQIDNGLPQNTVHAVLQSKDGFLWIATEGGLVRFDGFDFRVFDPSNTPEFHSSFVNNLLEDHAGALWIGTSDGLLRLSDGRFRAFSIADGLPSNVISKRAED